MPAASPQLTSLVRAHCNPPPGILFFDTPDAVRDDPTLIGYLPVIERAWQSLGLDGVLFTHGRPILYLKESRHALTPRERIRLHRLFWNQGVANVLVLADPSSVYVYSALAKPLRDDATEKEQALVETLTQAEYAQSTQAFFVSLATGAYYSEQEHRDCFQPRETVDAYLLDNLVALRDELCDGAPQLRMEMAHAFLGRLLFACYLLDRRIVNLDDKQSPSDVTGAARLEAILNDSRSFPQQRKFLYDWFAELKEQFNGTMFDQDLEAERGALRECHMEAVTHFLGGHEMHGRQRTLGFWAYDFQMIPVETISAIYESFLAGEDAQAKREGGAFYTPRFLAEMVLDVASEGGVDITTKRCLDPACGSGIFLVTLFSRMASAWLSRQPGKPTYAARVKAFQQILRTQIQGIDINETACRIACFSLYLAYLDRLAPPDIGEHARKTGKALPKLMASASDGSSSSGYLIPVVRKANALSDADDLNGAFDVVVGNPPWRERPDRLAQRFTEKAPDFLCAGGTGCLLLPTALLLNKTDDFQDRWLRCITLERIVNLADYRLLLFRNAKRPALIARFRNDQPRIGTAVVEHDAPKFRRDSLREGCITISPPDRSWIPLQNILAATREKTAPLLWKRHLWGTPRDQKLLALLLDMPPLSDRVELLSDLRRRKSARGKIWLAGQGIKPWRGDAADADRPLKPIGRKDDSLFLPARKWKSDLVVLAGDIVPLVQGLEAERYRSDVLYSRPADALFTPPMVLVSKGFGKVAFCDFPVLFQHAIQSITGPHEDRELLMFLAAYLRSPLARYFLFHTAGNWGTERDEVQLDELLRLPFPLPGTEYATNKADRIVRDVAERVHEFQTKLEHPPSRNGHLLDTHLSDAERRQLTDSVQAELNQFVYRYFGLTPQEIILIEDAAEVFIPSSTPHAWWSESDVFTLDPVEAPRPIHYLPGIGVYADTLTKTLNSWVAERGSPQRAVATGGCDKETGLAMVTLRLTAKETGFRQIDVSHALWQALDTFRKRASRINQGTLATERDIVLFHGKSIHIIRPGILANWTRTAALNDAARIYGEIALSGANE